MARHVLFLVHGMGSYTEPTWSDSVVATLKSAYKQFDSLSAKEFGDRFEVVPVSYDDQFEKLRNQWQESSEALKQVLADSGMTSALAKRVVGTANLGADDSFFWTHLMDVVLYRLLGLIKTPVEIAVARQIVGALQQRQLPAWSVLAHSLGTAVAHGALYRAYTAANPLVAQETKPTLVMMVANVSRVLQTSPKVYKSRVRPGLSTEGDRICRRYYSVRNQFDPFTWPKQFDPGIWPDEPTYRNGYYRSIVVRHVRQKNVHGWRHYLANPRVHVPLFRALTARDYISTEEESEARQEFDSQPMSTALAKVRDSLGDALPAPSSNWESLVRAGLKFARIIV